MGFTSQVCAFHYHRYTNCVVPAVRRMLRTGEPGLWLSTVWEHLHSATRRPTSPAAFGLPAASEWRTEDLMILSPDLADEPNGTGEMYWLPPRRSPERERLINLFQHVVEGCCLEPGEYMGRADPRHFDRHAVLPLASGRTGIDRSLERLGGRGTFWNADSGGWGEGICGWLNPSESEDLARVLRRVPLPDGVPGPDAFNTGDWANDRDRELRYQLGWLRRVARQAQSIGAGLLWGRDLHTPGRVWGEDRHRGDPGPYPPFAITDDSMRASAVRDLARVARDRRDFSLLPILADAFEENGCTNQPVLTHCRDLDEHVDGCWVIDLILEPAPPGGPRT